jgi:hypothetical protein
MGCADPQARKIFSCSFSLRLAVRARLTIAKLVRFLIFAKKIRPPAVHPFLPFGRKWREAPDESLR